MLNNLIVDIAEFEDLIENNDEGLACFTDNEIKMMTYIINGYNFGLHNLYSR